MKKHIQPFETECGETWITITFENGVLSITGVEGPRADGNANGACGQIVMHEWKPITYSAGYDRAITEKLRSIWETYHLNDMQAGSPSQRAYLKENPVTDKTDHYKRASKALEDAGINPDPNFIHNGKPYKYGSAWLRIEVPQGVIEWLFNLPEPLEGKTIPKVWK